MGKTDSISVLYLSYDGMTDALGESQVVAYLSRIASKSVKIDIISFEKQAIYSQKKKGIKDKLDEVNIGWYPLKYTQKPPVLSTILDISKGWKLIKKLQNEKVYDIVHCRGYITAILGMRMKKRFGTKYIFDMRGWWADEKLESGFWNGPAYRVVYNYFKKLELDFFKTSDYTVSLTNAGKKEIVDHNWKDPDRVGVIPTCVDFDIFKAFSESTRKEIRKELMIPEDAKVLLYSGSMGGNYGIDEFFEIFSVLDKMEEGCYFLILSKTDPGFIFQYVGEHNLDHEKIKIKSVGYRDVSKYLMAADYGLIYYKSSYSVIGRCPTKMGEYWASGLPVLSFKGIGDIDFILEKYPEAGVLIPEVKEEYIRASFHNLEKKSDKKYLRQAGLDYFSIEKGVEFYLNLYDQCLSKNNSHKSAV